MRRFFFGASLLVLAACSGAQTAAQGGGTQPQSQDAVVAEVGGRKITMKELDEKWQAFDAAERARVTQLLYQNRRNVLDQMVGDVLIEEAARAAGMTPAQFLEQERKKRAQGVSDADVKSFYEANKDRAQGRPFEQLQGQIREFLQSQREQQARAQLIDELKKKRGTDVKVHLDPPRQAVELALHDPSLGPLNAPVTIVEFSDYQ
jgi:protein-disulfide isomerase